MASRKRRGTPLVNNSAQPKKKSKKSATSSQEEAHSSSGGGGDGDGAVDYKVQFETDEFVFFWKPPSVYSQWTPSVFVVDGVEYNCTEQWMMAGKARMFKDEDVLAQIMKTTSPLVMKKLGRKVSNFDPQVWGEKCVELVVEGNVAKFEQNPVMLQELLATGDKTLVEASPMDKIWGVGMGAKNPKIQDRANWRGKNLLGECLMKARAILRSKQTSSSL